jgi:hypothetical protein
LSKTNIQTKNHYKQISSNVSRKIVKLKLIACQTKTITLPKSIKTDTKNTVASKKNNAINIITINTYNEILQLQLASDKLSSNCACNLLTKYTLNTASKSLPNRPITAV